MIIREYRQEDLSALLELFYHTVHTVNAADYTPAQLNAWADGCPDAESWNRSFLSHYTLVAVSDSGIITGFGDIDETGYLDRLYVHADYQNQGVASAICDRLEQTAPGTITTHASITAKPFFEKRGYTAVKKQEVIRRGISLTNFVMEKKRL